jgi:hypothetical protein
LIDKLENFVEWKYHAEGKRNNYRWGTAKGKRLMAKYGEKWFPARWVKEKLEQSLRLISIGKQLINV